MLLVDAFNVIRAQWALPADRRGMDLHALIVLIGRSRFAHRRLRVVVDGNPGPEWVRRGVAETVTGLVWTRVGKAEVVFSGRGFEADDVIEDILRRSKGLEITVVSSDRRLVDAAGRAGADQIGNGTFLRLLDEDRRRADGPPLPAFATDVPLDRYSIAHWMREFGFDPGLLERAAPAAAPPKAPEQSLPPKPPKDAFGQRLVVPATRPVPSPPPKPPEPVGDSREPLDPLLHEAFMEWYGTLHLADLDMSRWIDGVEPL